MTRPVPPINEIIGFAVLLLMAVALVAGEADATTHQAVRAAAAEAQATETTNTPFRTTINTQIGGQPVTISIEAVAENRRARFVD